MKKRIKVTDDHIIEISKISKSATHAASILGIKYETYRVHAKRLGCFFVNQSGKGTKKIKKDGLGKISLTEILDGKHPQYQTNKLRLRLFKEGYKDEKCELCGIESWLGKKISLELDHIDGNRYNHSLNNLRVLCPNCHSQTDTYRGKNKGGSGEIGETQST